MSDIEIDHIDFNALPTDHLLLVEISRNGQNTWYSVNANRCEKMDVAGELIAGFSSSFLIEVETRQKSIDDLLANAHDPDPLRFVRPASTSIKVWNDLPSSDLTPKEHDFPSNELVSTWAVIDKGNSFAFVEGARDTTTIVRIVGETNRSLEIKGIVRSMISNDSGELIVLTEAHGVLDVHKWENTNSTVIESYDLNYLGASVSAGALYCPRASKFMIVTRNEPLMEPRLSIVDGLERSLLSEFELLSDSQLTNSLSGSVVSFFESPSSLMLYFPDENRIEKIREIIPADSTGEIPATASAFNRDGTFAAYSSLTAKGEESVHLIDIATLKESRLLKTNGSFVTRLHLVQRDDIVN